jgi:hypothetical protein
MQKPMRNRRHFIKNLSVLSTGSIWLSSVVGMTALQSCSTIDEQLITDPSDLGDTVIIIGGGITGMYAAYQLRKRKIPYRIFEASSRLGGQILSDQDYEYGAFEFLNSDTNLLALAKDLNLKIEKIDTKSWVFKNGTNDLLNQMVERIGGVLPLQQIRLKNKLIQYQMTGNKFKVTFATESSDKIYKSSKILLALPAEKLFQIKGLFESSVDSEFQRQRHTRIVFPLSKLSSRGLAFKSKMGVLDHVQYSARVVRNMVYVDLKGSEAALNYPLEVEKLSSWVSEKVLDLPKLNLQLQPENIFIWNHSVLLKSDLELKMNSQKNSLIISDGIVSPQNRIESLLVSVNQQIDEFL